MPPRSGAAILLLSAALLVVATAPGIERASCRQPPPWREPRGLNTRGLAVPERDMTWRYAVLAASCGCGVVGCLTALFAVWLDPTRGELLAAVIAAATIQGIAQLLTLLAVARQEEKCAKRHQEACRFERDVSDGR